MFIHCYQFEIFKSIYFIKVFCIVWITGVADVAFYYENIHQVHFNNLYEYQTINIEKGL